ncbi:MAG: transcription antitermination factor NusB, partial [Acidobacteriota bacterium]
MRPRVTPARRAAFDVLYQVKNEEAYASSLLSSDRYDHLSREDRALLQELVLGVLRWQGQLDFLIERYSRRKLAALDATLVLILRLGLYQLRFLERVPAHAAINESVNLARERKLSSAAPLVNASLRNAQRELKHNLDELILEVPEGIGRLTA